PSPTYSTVHHCRLRLVSRLRFQHQFTCAFWRLRTKPRYYIPDWTNNVTLLIIKVYYFCPGELGGMLSRNIYNSTESSSGDSGKGRFDAGCDISTRSYTPYRAVTSSRVYKPYIKDHSNEAAPTSNDNIDLDTDTSAAISTLLAELLSANGASEQ